MFCDEPVAHRRLRGLERLLLLGRRRVDRAAGVDEVVGEDGLQVLVHLGLQLAGLGDAVDDQRLEIVRQALVPGLVQPPEREQVGVLVEDDVLQVLVQLLADDVGQAVLGALGDAGRQRRVELAPGDRRRVAAQVLHHLDLQRRVDGADLHHTAQTIAAVSDTYRKRTMGVLRVAFLSSAVLEFFSSISIALVAVYLAMSYLGYLSFGVYGEPLSLAGGLFILLLAPDFYLPLRELGTHYHARAEAVGAAEEILKILAVPHPDALNGKINRVQTGPLHIKFQNVWLAFDGGRRPALQGINFDLKSGEQVVLVGGSGAGKTTTLNLLLGFITAG